MATAVQTVDTGHADMLHDAQLDFYGRRLATCSSDRTIKLFDVSADEHTPSGEIAAHEGPVWQVAWAHPQFGVLLASCGYDRRAIIHREVSQGNWMRIYSHESHASSVNSITWAPHEYGLQLAAASSDGSISILTHRDDDSWHVATVQDCPTGCNAISWAPAAHVGGTVHTSTGGAGGAGAGTTTTTTTMISTFVKRLAVAGSDGKVRLHRCRYEATTGTEKWESQAIELPHGPHKEWVRDVAWSPASGMGGNILASCSDDGIVALWTQSTPGDDTTWQAGAVLPQFQSPVWRVSWSATGHLLAVSCGDNSFSLWRQSGTGEWQQVSAVPDPTLIGRTTG